MAMLIKANSKLIVLSKYFLILGGILFFLFNYQQICLLTDYRFLKGKFLEMSKAQGFWQEDLAVEQGIIRILEINLEAPLIVPKNNSLKEIEKSLKNGAVLYSDIQADDQNPLKDKKPLIILGHSAPLNWPKAGNYDWIFSNLNNLTKGDNLTLFLNNKKIFYKVEGKEIVEKGKDLSLFLKKDHKKTDLILISCWPPGKNSQRIVIFATLR